MCALGKKVKAFGYLPEHDSVLMLMIFLKDKRNKIEKLLNNRHMGNSFYFKKI